MKGTRKEWSRGYKWCLANGRESEICYKRRDKLRGGIFISSIPGPRQWLPLVETETVFHSLKVYLALALSFQWVKSETRFKKL